MQVCESHESLVREVSASSATLDAIEGRLVGVDRKQDQITLSIENMRSEFRGELTRLSRQVWYMAGGIASVTAALTLIIKIIG